MVLASLMAVGLLAQAAPVAVERPPLDVNVPSLAGLRNDPTCGGREAMATIASCFATTQAAAETVVDAWNTAFAAQGWLAADGSDNRIIYVRRKAGGGCDAFQLLAFAPTMSVPAPEAPAFLALAAVPGDICAAEAAQ